MRANYISFVIGLIFLFSSCFKEDDRVEPHDPGDVETVVIEMTSTYKYQLYFDFSSDSVISQNLKTDYDLGFGCADTGWHIILNTANFMMAGNTGQTDFNAPADTTGLVWKYDKSNGDLDSTAIGDWLAISPDDSSHIYSNHVYIIDRGYDELGNLRGLKKVVFERLEINIYSIRYSNYDGSDEQTMSITKNPAVNFIYFSFDDGGRQLDLEPANPDWDLIFTQYTTLLFTDANEPYPYLVTGALSNRSHVGVAQETSFDFDDIDLNLAQDLLYSSALDVVGYDWKDVVGDVTSGIVTYVMVPDLSYVIHDAEGFFYKLRFVNFYSTDPNNPGEKGYPTLEYQRL